MKSLWLWHLGIEIVREPAVHLGIRILLVDDVGVLQVIETQRRAQ